MPEFTPSHPRPAHSGARRLTFQHVEAINRRENASPPTDRASAWSSIKRLCKRVGATLLATGTLLTLPLALPAVEQSPLMIGVNLAGAEFGGDVIPGSHGTNYIYPGPRELDYYKARGIELIRLPFKWERIQPTLYSPLDSAELSRLDNFLDELERRGMLVILDVHNYARYKISGTAYRIGSPQVPRSAFQDLWTRLAAHVKHRDSIWAYGIMNEPYDMGVYTWKDSAQAAVDGVRSEDMKNAILLPGDAYSGAHWWLTYGADMIEVDDPADNVIFEAHQYFDQSNEGAYNFSYDGENAYPNRGVDRLSEFVSWCNQNDVRGHIGEFGVPDDDPRWLTLMENALDYMVANNISGTYWAGGPWWGDYRLSSETKRLHDEAPQMAVLMQYSDAPGTMYWPPYTWYHDAIATSPSGSYGYSYKSTTATVAVDFDSPDAAYYTSLYSTAKGIDFSYTIPSGGWAGGGMHLNGGVKLDVNFARGHELSFYLKGTAGSSVRVFFYDESNNLSAKINTASYVTTSGSWQQVKIPLSAFVNGSFDGSERVVRLAFEGLPTDNVAREVQLDRFVVERPVTQAPAVSAAISGGSSHSTNTPITATATASSPDSSIDMVEFYVDSRRVGFDETSPYSTTFTLAEAGDYSLTAIAYDIQGRPERSSEVALQATGSSVSDSLTWVSTPSTIPTTGSFEVEVAYSCAADRDIVINVFDANNNFRGDEKISRASGTSGTAVITVPIDSPIAAGSATIKGEHRPAGGTYQDSLINIYHSTTASSGSPNTYSGSWSAEATVTGSSTWGNFYQQPSSILTQTNHVASFWMKGSGKITLRVLSFGWGTVLAQQEFTATSSWTQFTLPTFNSGSNTSLVYCFSDSGDTAGTFYIDACFLGQSGGSNKLANADFESGSSAWQNGSGLFSILQNP